MVTKNKCCCLVIIVSLSGCVTKDANNNNQIDDRDNFQSRLLSNIYKKRSNINNSRRTYDEPSATSSVTKTVKVVATNKTEAETKQVQQLKPKYYTVGKGDTLYSIAKENNIDLVELLRMNNISNDYVINVGQQLILAKPNIVSSHGADNNNVKLDTAIATQTWIWPVKNAAIVNKFSDATKGLILVQKIDTPIYAASTGEVVYSGNALRGYGNLVIIKHDSNYLTAYAHNNSILVKEGDKVVLGQQIATMGRTGTDSVKLHFELRKNGKPVDPIDYLPERS